MRCPLHAAKPGVFCGGGEELDVVCGSAFHCTHTFLHFYVHSSCAFASHTSFFPFSRPFTNSLGLPLVICMSKPLLESQMAVVLSFCHAMQLNACAPPELHHGTARVHIKSFLGMGASSTAYGCTLEGNSDSAQPSTTAQAAGRSSSQRAAKEQASARIAEQARASSTSPTKARKPLLVAKVPHEGRKLNHEEEVLRKLGQKNCPGVPRL